MKVLCRRAGCRQMPLLVVCSAVTAGLMFAQSEGEKYRNPIVFQRAHLDEKTGDKILAGKLWVMEEDGSRLRQLTTGTSYDEHSSFYSDQEHVLYSEFAANQYDHAAGARADQAQHLHRESGRGRGRGRLCSAPCHAFADR